jgi:hypothetical protein
VDLVDPDISVTKSCVEEPVAPGSSANFIIDVWNSGDIELTASVTDSLLGIADTGIILPPADLGTCVFDEYESDGCLRYEEGVIAEGSEVVNTVEVSGEIPQTGLPNVVTATAGASCEVAGGATRTRGFWQTHGSNGDRWDIPLEFGYTCHVLEEHLMIPGDDPLNPNVLDFGWTVVEDCPDALGIFWSNNAATSTGDRRTDKVCKASVNASKQLMAAILNTALTNGAPPPDDPYGMYGDAIEALIEEMGADDPDVKKINKLASVLDAYNNSYDDVAIEDGDGAIIPPADPNGVRDYMDLTVGDACQ